MNEELQETPVETVTKKKVSVKVELGIRDWFMTKGWIYLMVFVMGILMGGLIFK